MSKIIPLFFRAAPLTIAHTSSTVLSPLQRHGLDQAFQAVLGGPIAHRRVIVREFVDGVAADRKRSDQVNLIDAQRLGDPEELILGTVEIGYDGRILVDRQPVRHPARERVQVAQTDVVIGRDRADVVIREAARPIWS